MKRSLILIGAITFCIARITAGACLNLNGVTYGNGKYVAVGSGGAVAVSSDESSWTYLSSGTASDLYAVIYAANQFIAVGSAGTIIASSDGITWSQRESNTGQNLTKCAYGNNIIVVSCDSGIMVGPADSIGWALRSVNQPKNARTILFGNGIFIALCDGTSAANPPWIWTSTDGAVWTKKASGYFYNVCVADSQFVAVGSDSICSSSNGVIWKKSKGGFSMGPGEVEEIIYASHQFVAVGYSHPSMTTFPVIYTSPDGATWTSRSSGGARYNGIVYGNNGFVIVGTYVQEIIPMGCSIYTSVDGIIWQNASSLLSVCRPRFDYDNEIARCGNRLWYTIPRASAVSIKLYDFHGRCKETLVNSTQLPGRHTVELPLKMSPGAYILQLNVGRSEAMKLFSIGK